MTDASEVERLRRRVAALEAELAEAREREARLVRESDTRGERLIALAAELDRYRAAARREEPPARKVALRGKGGGAPKPPPPPPKRRE